MPAPWENYATPQAAPPDQAAQAAGPWQKYAAPVDMRPRQSTSEPEQPVEQQGMFRSFYNGAIKPVVDMVQDTYARGDMGAKAAGDILDAFKDQVKHFAGHPDIRNLPVAGPGATETAARMQKQYDAGNYSGMIGSAAGFIAPFAAPEILARAPEVPGAIADAAKGGAQKLRNMLPEGGIPTVPGMVADIAGAVHPGAGFAIRAGNRVAKVANAVLGPKAAEAAALTPGEQTVADMRAQIAARDAEDAAAAGQDAAWEKTHPPEPYQPAAREATPPEPAGPWEKYAPPSRSATADEVEAVQNRANWVTRESPTSTNPPEPIPPARPDPLWKTLGRDDPKIQPVISDVGIPGSLPSGRAVGRPAHYGTPATAEPVPAAAPQTATPAAPQTVPPITAAQRIEDAADEQAARMQHQAEDIIWANRARKADRFTAYLTQHKLDPTPENLATAAKAMGERAAPSDETVPMIQDRMGYQEPAALKSAAGNATLPEEPNNAAATQTANQGPAVRSQSQPGAIPAPRRAGEGAQTVIDVPGEGVEYPGRYVVRELAEVNPSHSGITFERNPAYPYENDRDYSNPVNQERVVLNSMPGRFKPRYLITDNSDAGNGPPIIEPAGHVLGGNNRSMILDRAYRNPQSAAAYRDMLTQKAATFGVDPAEIAGMKQPVLLREMDPAANPQRAITDFNKTGTAALTGAERATADARNLNPDVASYIGGKIEAEGDGATLNDALTGKSGIGIINHLVDSGVFTMQEKPNLIDARTGIVTAAAKDRISKMLTGTMFRDSDQMARIAPEIRNKLERAAPSVLQSQAKAEWDLAPTVRSAVDLVEYASAHGIKNLNDVLAQSALFGGEPEFSPRAVAMADAIRKLTPTELGKRFKSYMADSVPSMFGEVSSDTAFNDHFGSGPAAPAPTGFAAQSKAAFDAAKTRRRSKP